MSSLDPLQCSDEPGFGRALRIDRVVGINLDRRPDRWELLRADCEVAGVPIERFSATDGQVAFPKARAGGGSTARANRGRRGCTDSHRRVLEDALERGVETLMVLEDDAVVPPDFWARLNAAAVELPDDWELLHLVPIHYAYPIPFSPSWTRAVRTMCTAAYVLRGEAIMRDLAAVWTSWRDSTDIVWHPILNARGFCAEPVIVHHRPGFSDIREIEVGRLT